MSIISPDRRPRAFPVQSTVERNSWSWPLTERVDDINDHDERDEDNLLRHARH